MQRTDTLHGSRPFADSSDGNERTGSVAGDSIMGEAPVPRTAVSPQCRRSDTAECVCNGVRARQAISGCSQWKWRSESKNRRRNA